jgi:leucyl/phenylalanyl-tRNA--protein transferase
MPVYLLDRTDTFPPASEAEASGLLAVGGDLRLSRLLRAYSEGIFPWYSQGEPILWFSPDPRAVIDPGRVRLGRGMRRTLTGAAELDLTMDAAFSRVIRACARVARTGQRGTWITTEMIEAYEGLHQSGYAHSVEAWAGERLVGASRCSIWSRERRYEPWLLCCGSSRRGESSCSIVRCIPRMWGGWGPNCCLALHFCGA